MTEMGFSDHLPMVVGWKPGYSMRRSELDGYVTLVRSLAGEYAPAIRILLGIEADYFPAAEAEIAALLADYPFDYVIGSVHFLGDGFAYDHSDNRGRYEDLGVDRIYLEAYELVAAAAGSGLFDVIGHFDLPKKFGHRPADAERVAAAAGAALQAVKRAGAAIELNTAGWRKPVGEAYPALDLLTEAAGLDIPLTFGSDAHRPEEVGDGFGRAIDLAREAGYGATLRLSTRRPERLS